MKKLKDFFVGEHYFDPDQKLGFWEGVIFEHYKDDDIYIMTRRGLRKTLKGFLFALLIVSILFFL